MKKIKELPLIVRAADVASDCQIVSASVEMWELGAVMHRVDRDRFTELNGLIAAAGEQLGLARAALIECLAWREFDGDRNGMGADMCQRAMGELLMYYCLSTGHALANITARLLAFDFRLRDALVDHFESTFPPHSQETQDWLAANLRTARSLRRVQRLAAFEPSSRVAGPLSTVTQSGLASGGRST